MLKLLGQKIISNRNHPTKRFWQHKTTKSYQRLELLHKENLILASFKQYQTLPILRFFSLIKSPWEFYFRLNQTKPWVKTHTSISWKPKAQVKGWNNHLWDIYLFKIEMGMVTLLVYVRKLRRTRRRARVGLTTGRVRVGGGIL